MSPSKTTDGDNNTAVEAAATAVRDAALLVSGPDYRALVDKSKLSANVAVFAQEFFATAGRMANPESYVATDIEALEQRRLLRLGLRERRLRLPRGLTGAKNMRG